MPASNKLGITASATADVLVACTHLGMQQVHAGSTLLLHFVSDDVWGIKGVCRLVSRSIAAYLVKAWDVRNSCKQNGAVLLLSSAPGGGRGADGVDAMA
jgi:hypothetical protein